MLSKTHFDKPTYVTPDNQVISRMLHKTPEENKLLLEQDAQSVRVHTAEYEIDNRSVYDILGQICKVTNLYISPREMAEG